MNICPFKKFKFLLGIPKKGVHRYTFLNTAVVDYVLTILAAMITTYFTKFPLVLSTITWFVVSIFMHTMVGLNTNSVKWLGLTCS